MTVYVDDMEAVYTPSHTPRRYIMCHMIADTEKELHDMADFIGVSRKWYQGDHYDITKTKRKLAVVRGAREITQRQLALMVALRRRGYNSTDPGTVLDEYRRMREQRPKGE